ncbi:hypothetical protein AYI70_g8936 [Smittium culicis]|uniref:Uncharacterized protein n=1 Tax=Smittium culicis TaxID=133412 RepID=A0A1R1XDL8_9FUNG|nr:hypothetical protein AYI70_g8936 [Smittium culicis]
MPKIFAYTTLISFVLSHSDLYLYDISTTSLPHLYYISTTFVPQIYLKSTPALHQAIPTIPRLNPLAITALRTLYNYTPQIRINLESLRNNYLSMNSISSLSHHYTSIAYTFFQLNPDSIPIRSQPICILSILTID